MKIIGHEPESARRFLDRGERVDSGLVSFWIRPFGQVIRGRVDLRGRAQPEDQRDAIIRSASHTSIPAFTSTLAPSADFRFLTPVSATSIQLP